MKAPTRGTAIGQLIAAMVASSLLGVLAKWSLLDVAPFTFVWVQVACASLALAGYTFGFRGERIPAGLSGRIWLQWIAIGLINFGLVRLFMMLSLERLPATTHAYLLSFVGIATMVLSLVWLREKPSWQQCLGALVAILGVRVFFREIPDAGEWTGVIYVGIVVVGLAMSNNLTRGVLLQTEGRLSSLMLSTLALMFGGVPLVLWGVATDWPPPIDAAAHWGVIVLSGVVGIGVVQAVFNAGLRTLRSYEASLLAGSGILWTALFAAFVLGERLSQPQGVGIGLMIAGLVLSQLRGGPTRQLKRL